jgi:hypothetical protein
MLKVGEYFFFILTKGYYLHWSACCKLYSLSVLQFLCVCNLPTVLYVINSVFLLYRLHTYHTLKHWKIFYFNAIFNVFRLRCGQGCQMVCFQTKTPKLGKFWRVLDGKMLLFSWRFGIFYKHVWYFMTIWYILCSFGTFFHRAPRKIWLPCHLMRICNFCDCLNML